MVGRRVRIGRRGGALLGRKTWLMRLWTGSNIIYTGITKRG